MLNGNRNLRKQGDLYNLSDFWCIRLKNIYWVPVRYQALWLAVVIQWWTIQTRFMPSWNSYSCQGDINNKSVYKLIDVLVRFLVANKRKWFLVTSDRKGIFWRVLKNSELPGRLENKVRPSAAVGSLCLGCHHLLAGYSVLPLPAPCPRRSSSLLLDHTA